MRTGRRIGYVRITNTRIATVRRRVNRQPPGHRIIQVTAGGGAIAGGTYIGVVCTAGSRGTLIVECGRIAAAGRLAGGTLIMHGVTGHPHL